MAALAFSIAGSIPRHHTDLGHSGSSRSGSGTSPVTAAVAAPASAAPPAAAAAGPAGAAPDVAAPVATPPDGAAGGASPRGDCGAGAVTGDRGTAVAGGSRERVPRRAASAAWVSLSPPRNLRRMRRSRVHSVSEVGGAVRRRTESVSVRTCAVPGKPSSE